jgi:hypothetical protein
MKNSPRGKLSGVLLKDKVSHLGWSEKFQRVKYPMEDVISCRSRNNHEIVPLNGADAKLLVQKTESFLQIEELKLKKSYL